METILNTATSLNYPGILYAGFSTKFVGSSDEKRLDFVLSNAHSPESKCPKISLKFRQIEERKFFFKKIPVWVADVQLTNCGSIYSDSETFVGIVEIWRNKYETTLVIIPKDNNNRLYNLHSKWNMKIQFEYSNKEIGEYIVKFITENLNIQLATKNKN